MKPRKPKKKAETKKSQKKAPQSHSQDVLDSALEDSFPASDPISMTEPAPSHESPDRQPSREEEEQEPAPGP